MNEYVVCRRRAKKSIDCKSNGQRDRDEAEDVAARRRVDRQGGRAFRTNKKKATHAAVERGRPTKLVNRAPSSPAVSDSGDSSTAIVRPHVPVGPHSCSDEEEMRDLR